MPRFSFSSAKTSMKQMRRDLRTARAEIKDLEDATKHHTKELLHYDTKGKIADAYIFEKKGNWEKNIFIWH